MTIAPTARRVAVPPGRGTSRLNPVEARDRMTNLGFFAAAALVWLLVALVVTTRDPRIDTGPTPIDPFRVLAAWEVAGDRLALAAAAGERVLLATGHPAGLTLLYQAFGELLERGDEVRFPDDQWLERFPLPRARILHTRAALAV